MGFIKPKPKLSLRVNPKRKDNPVNETQQASLKNDIADMKNGKTDVSMF